MSHVSKTRLLSLQGLLQKDGLDGGQIEWMKKKGGGKCVLLFCNFQGESSETKEQLKGKVAGCRALGIQEKEMLGWRFSQSCCTAKSQSNL